MDINIQPKKKLQSHQKPRLKMVRVNGSVMWACKCPLGQKIKVRPTIQLAVEAYYK